MDRRHGNMPPPETRLHYAQLTGAFKVTSAVLDLTGYERNNPAQMVVAVMRAAEHNAVVMRRKMREVRA